MSEACLISNFLLVRHRIVFRFFFFCIFSITVGLQFLGTTSEPNVWVGIHSQSCCVSLLLLLEHQQEGVEVERYALEHEHMIEQFACIYGLHVRYIIF